MLTRSDFSGSARFNGKYGRIFRDQTVVALDKVRFVGDPVAAVAATHDDIAAEALSLIEVEYEELPAIFDEQEALKPGAPLVHDPRPEQHFYERSDNYAFARRGVVAQTLSTFDPENHHDYHGVDDEREKLDFDHMAVSVRASLPAVNALASGKLTPQWKPGGDPSKAQRGKR